METIKFRGLRSSFILYVLTTLVVVAVLSGLTIWGCVTLQKLYYQTPIWSISQFNVAIPMEMKQRLRFRCL